MEKEYDLKGLSVCIGMPVVGNINPHTVGSLIGTIQLCNKVGVTVDVQIISGCSVIQWARDEVVHAFLGTDCRKLFWIDSDITWEPLDFMKLVAFSLDYDVVCATYPAKIDNTPNIEFYVGVDKESVENADEMGLIDVDGIGLGFTIMDGTILDKMNFNAEKAFDEVSGKEISQIFKVGINEDGKRFGEDMAFFADIKDLGYEVKLDPSISLGHVGNRIYKGSVLEGLTNLE